MNEKLRREGPVSRPGHPVGDDEWANPSSVRGRTLRHMRKLLTHTAAAGAALQLSGCIDPLPPPPLDCTADVKASDLRFHLGRLAWWVQTEDRLLVLVELDLYFIPHILAFSGEPTLEGATLVESEIATDNIGLLCTPLEGATSVTLSVPITCEEEVHNVQLVLDVSGTPQLGEKVPISDGE